MKTQLSIMKHNSTIPPEKVKRTNAAMLSLPTSAIMFQLANVLNLKTLLGKSKLALLALLFLGVTSGFAQTTVFSDDFSTNSSTTFTTSGAIGASAWNVLVGSGDFGARRNVSPAQLELTNDATATANANGWVFCSTSTSSFLSPYNTSLSSNPGLVTWTLNIRQIRTDPAGLASGSYGTAFVLAGTSTTTSTVGTGYAITYGQSGSTDPLRLVKYTAGIATSTNLIVSNTSGLTDFGADYLSVKVTYQPSSNTWELFLRNDGASAFVNPTTGTLVSQGTAVDNAYTGTALTLMGAYWSGSTAASQTAFVDNVGVTVSIPVPTITLSTNSLANFGSVQVSSSSSEATYNVSAANLTDTLHLYAPAQFEISLSSGSGFNDTLFLLPSSGSVSSTTIFARFTPTSNGAVTDSIIHSSAGAPTKKVGVSGTGTSCSPPNITAGGPTTFCSGGSVVLTADAGVSYLWSTAETTQSITVTNAGNYSVAVTDGSNCTATSAPTTVTVNSFSISGIVFSENMGSPAVTTVVNSYTGWQNYGLLSITSTSAGQTDVRTSTPSNYSGASGGGNVWFTTSGTRNIVFSGINTSGYTGLTLSFGMLKSSTDLLEVSTSPDGVTYTPLTTSTQPVANNWGVVTVTSGIPSYPNLHIKFEKTTGSSFRLDDVALSGTASSIFITAGGSTTICAGSSVLLSSNIATGNEWSPVFAFSQSILATTAGSYTVTASDGNGCSATSAPVVVSVVAAPSANTSTTDALCAGDSTGTATAVGTGGAGGFSYSWNTSPVQTDSTATGLPAGTYTVTVTDVGGCSGTATATVSEPLPIQIITSSTPPSTIGGNDGTATAFAYDGTGPFTYEWNTSPIQYTDVATGLTAGTYVVIATDANGCTETAQEVVVDPIPAISVSTTALGDFGNVVVGNSSYEDTYSASGIYLTDSILITAPAGFEISLTSGSGFGSQISLYPSSGLVPSTLIYVRFTPGSVGAASGNITHTSTGAVQKDVAVSGTGISCLQATITAGGPTTFCQGGSVTLTASAGTSYLWSNAETTQSIVVTTSGSYTVDVTDAFNCTSTTAAEVVTVTNFSVTGAVLSENMGTPGGNTFVNSYTGWQNQGSYSYQSTLTNQSDVRTSSVSTGYAGASGSGNVFMGTAGGTDPRDFIISGINTTGYTGLTLSFGMLRTNTAENLAVSVSTDGVNYSPITTTVQPVQNVWALVSDSIGSIPATDNLRIKFSKSTSISFRIDDIILSGTTDTLIVTASGPLTSCSAQPLTLTSNISVGNNWSPVSAFSQAIHVNTSDTYFTTVTDLNGCIKTSPSFVVNVNPSPLVDTLISTNLLCNGDSSGTISASVSGGTAPYSYSWNSVPVQTTINATNLHSGFYTFVVTDINGCTASQGRFVSQPAALSATASAISHPTSIGATDGSIGSSVIGGTTPYTYSWTASSPTTVTVSLNPVKDNNIFADNTSNSNATGPNFVAGNNAGGFARRALLAFDIASNIPAGATITNATLDLNMVHTSSGAGAQNFDLYPLLENWGEGSSFDAGNPGNGVAATAGDATWINSFDPGTPWTTAGGEFNPSSSATTSVDAIGVYTWTGGNLVADVQNWLDNAATDFGWILIGNESTGQTAKRFDSRENATPANRPTLTVTYTTQTVLGTGATITGLGAGIYTVTVVDSNGCTTTASDTLFDPLPEITVSVTSLPDFGNTVVGNPSGEQTYSVSGINLTDSILVSASADFEVSLTTGSGFGSSVTLYHTAGVVSNTTIFARFVPSAGGPISGTIAHTSTGAVQKNVTVSGTGTTCSQATITPSGPTTFCVGGSVTLTASSGASYLWSNGETTSSITTDTSGTFSVIVTDAFSCSSTTAPTTVTVNTFAFVGTIFSENVGNSGGTVALNTYTGWQNNGVLGFSTNVTGPSDVRTSAASNYVGASGLSNVFMGTGGGNSKDFIISKINTLGYTNMQLTFGMLRTSTSELLAVSVSADSGQTYTPLTTSTQPGASTSVWGAAPIVCSGTIPSVANLYIKFSKSTTTQFRIDDIKLTGTATSVVITPSGPTTFCQGSQVTLSSNIPSANVWSPGLETSKSIVVNSSGTYGLTVTDGNGCTASASPIVVNVNQIPVVNTTVTDVSCNGGSDGTATANVTAGTAPFTYSWNTMPVQTTQTATGLSAGTYKVVVTGAIGCKDSATAVVAEPGVIVPTCTIVNHVSCNGGSDGATSVSATGGTGAITVSGAPTSGLSAGSYTYTFTDANGCTATCTLVITEPSAIVPTCSVVNHVTCNGGADGATSVSATGGTGAITVSGAPTTGLSAGSYTYTFTDANGCTATCTLVITEPAAIVVSGFSPGSGPVGTIVTISGSGFTGATDVQFNGITASYTVDNDGQITATVPVGASTGPITVLVGTCQGISTGNFIVGSANMLVDLKLFLEGSYLGGSTMWSTLYDLGYSSDPTETDTIEVNLWSAAAVTANVGPDYSEKVILHNDGTASVDFGSATPDAYYIAIRHRNAIETWSLNAISLSSGANPLYDFSLSLSQAYDDGFNPPMQNMGGVYAFYSGDANQDGTVDGTDLTDVDNDNNLFAFGYNVTDCTGDGATDSSDLIIVDNNKNLFLFYARPY
ncbi:MAG: hypothetical protein EYC69_12160 [Bacteroidetes bacterium]|nr:MAG: hypothetical protein EYC69_12160 [Bacteroidota bacterium]